MKRILVLVVLSAVALSACRSTAQPGAANTQAVKMAPVSQMPAEVRQAPATVREAYQFAVANPQVLEHVPCYCGCGSIGHKSNLACYVQEFKSDGSIKFDDHALGCSLCVDIARDSMRMTREGKSLEEIRAAIVSSYSQFRPPNQ
jgi:hypothetical protein